MVSVVFTFHTPKHSTKYFDEDFNQNHDLQWGRMYHAGDIKIEWHGIRPKLCFVRVSNLITFFLVPNEEEVAFILQILDRVAEPLSTRLFALLENTPSWDNVARNDFCRYDKPAMTLTLIDARLNCLPASYMRCEPYGPGCQPSSKRYQRRLLIHA